MTAPPPTNIPIERIVLIGDLHFAHMPSEDLCRQRDMFYTALFAAIAQTTAVDHVVFLGDMTEEGDPATWQELQAVWSPWRRERSVRYVLGNHDVQTESACLWLGHPRWQAWESSAFAWLCLDTTAPPHRRKQTWGGWLDGAQSRAWRQSCALSEARQKPLLVCGHHPVYETTAYATWDHLYLQPKHAVAFLCKQPVTAGVYACGHNHRHSIARSGRWLYVQTASVLDVPSYRVLDVFADRVCIHTVFLPHLDVQAHAVRSAMPRYRPNDDAQGAPSDHECTFVWGEEFHS